MRLALLTGVAAAALSFIGNASAETIYVTDPDFVADRNVIITQPDVVATRPGYGYAVPPRPFGPPTPQYIVTQPTVVVAPPAVAPPTRIIERERVVISSPARTIAPRARVLERERAIAPRARVVERERVIAPRERVVERERVIIQPSEPVVAPPRASGIITTGYSSSGCLVDRNGFERCY